MKKNILVLTIIFFSAFNNLIAQIIPGDSIWKKIIPHFEHINMVEYDTVRNSTYVFVDGYYNRKTRTHHGFYNLGLHYGNVAKVDYLINKEFIPFDNAKRVKAKFKDLDYEIYYCCGTPECEKFLKYSDKERYKFYPKEEIRQKWNSGTFQLYQYQKEFEDNKYFVAYAMFLAPGDSARVFIDVVQIPKNGSLKKNYDYNTLTVDLFNNKKSNINELLFDIGKSTITKSSEKIIEIIAQYLTIYPDVKLQVNGHTDNVGSENQNLELSEQRAIAVVNSLVEDYGISRTRLIPHGFGEEKPIAENSTEEGRKLNRRVELVVDE